MILQPQNQILFIFGNTIHGKLHTHRSTNSHTPTRTTKLTHAHSFSRKRIYLLLLLSESHSLHVRKRWPVFYPGLLYLFLTYQFHSLKCSLLKFMLHSPVLINLFMVAWNTSICLFITGLIPCVLLLLFSLFLNTEINLIVQFSLP